uniref:Uncharacterized protein n=1 Tax=Arundo donax TaxID=35708 RepID=A0A0A9HAA7_ARUDO
MENAGCCSHVSFYLRECMITLYQKAFVVWKIMKILITERVSPCTCSLYI